MICEIQFFLQLISAMQKNDCALMIISRNSDIMALWYKEHWYDLLNTIVIAIKSQQ